MDLSRRDNTGSGDTRLPMLTDEDVARLMAQPVWTVQETARFLRVGERVIRKLVDDGVIFAYRVGRWIRIPRDCLQADLRRDASAAQAADHNAVVDIS